MNAAELALAEKAGVLDTDRRLSVAERRPPGLDRFVYGVRSTGIFCRSDCPSRRPTRSPIVFFESPREAVASGYQACRRCHPERGLEYSAPLAAVEKACRILGTAADRSSTLGEIARQVGYSPSHFQRVFTDLLGVSPKQYSDTVRIGRFREGLRQGRPVRSATYSAGRRSLSWPYAQPATGLGMDAGTYRRGGAHESIEYVTVTSPLGPLLVAATPRGICFVAFGGSAAELVIRLRREFPRAELLGAASSALTAWSHRILESLEVGRRPLTDLPTDLRATTFQARVWNAVRAIARGQTRTYAEIAREIGSDGGARAVARAIATNPVALLVPCHRVVRSDGALGGYRWGLERKQRLLEAERETGSPQRIAED